MTADTCAHSIIVVTDYRQLRRLCFCFELSKDFCYRSIALRCSAIARWRNRQMTKTAQFIICEVSCASDLNWSARWSVVSAGLYTAQSVVVVQGCLIDGQSAPTAEFMSVHCAPLIDRDGGANKRSPNSTARPNDSANTSIACNDYRHITTDTYHHDYTLLCDQLWFCDLRP